MMIRITPQMRILVAVEPVGFRCGIEGPGAALQTARRLGTGRSSCFRALSCVLCNVNCDLRHYLPRLPASDMGCRDTPAPLVRLG